MIRVLLLSLGLAMAGCAPRAGVSKVSLPALSEKQYAQLANDASEEIAKTYLPAKTRFYLVMDDGSFFSRELAARLREAGYSVGGMDSGDGEYGLGCAVITLADDQALVTVEIGENALMRLYTTANNDLLPESGWSRRIANDA